MTIKMMMCREATRLMSKRLDTDLRMGERLSLMMHLSMCGACRQCNRQFQLLHSLEDHWIPGEPSQREE